MLKILAVLPYQMWFLLKNILSKYVCVYNEFWVKWDCIGPIRWRFDNELSKNKKKNLVI